MENWRNYLDPEEMTPEERLERVVELMATGALRLIREEQDVGRTNSISSEKSENIIPTTSNIPIPPKKGRVPFGERITTAGREVNEVELAWIKRIQELASQGCSSEYIAEKLNEEDHESKRAGKWSRVAVWRILKGLKEKPVT